MGTGVAPQSVEEYIAALPEEERELARHVLLGDINQKTGRPVGFHHAPNGMPPPGRRVLKVLERYPDGSYRALTSFWDPARKRWVRKHGEHTMFPDSWTRERVLAAGREAYEARVEDLMGKWKGRGDGLRIGGYRRRGRVRGGAATFYPDHGR